MKFVKNYSGLYEDDIEVNNNQYHYSFNYFLTVQIGFFTYLLDFINIKDYVISWVINDIKIICDRHNYYPENPNVNINKIEREVKYSLQKELGMYKDIQVLNFYIK